jgi:hypothetical protein
VLADAGRPVPLGGPPGSRVNLRTFLGGVWRVPDRTVVVSADARMDRSTFRPPANLTDSTFDRSLERPEV